MKEFIINENDADQRVDRFIQKTMKTMPKSLMYKYIRNKKIKVNRKRCEISQRLQVGDTMQCYIPEEFYEVATMRSFLQVPNALDVVYEDDAVLLINKPKGLRAHSDTSEVQDNLADRLLHYLYCKKEYNPTTEQSFTPALCHRIDRNTQGLVIAAKTAAALRCMNEKIALRQVEKKYLCIVQGKLKKSRIISCCIIERMSKIRRRLSIVSGKAIPAWKQAIVCCRRQSATLLLRWSCTAVKVIRFELL